MKILALISRCYDITVYWCGALVSINILHFHLVNNGIDNPKMIIQSIPLEILYRHLGHFKEGIW